MSNSQQYPSNLRMSYDGFHTFNCGFSIKVIFCIEDNEKYCENLDYLKTPKMKFTFPSGFSLNSSLFLVLLLFKQLLKLKVQKKIISLKAFKFTSLSFS